MGVQLVGLLLDDTGQVKDVSLEASAELLHTAVGLLLGLSDVRHSLCETLVLERGGGVQGSIHTGRGMGQSSIGSGTVLGHGVANLVDLGSSLGSELGVTLLGLLGHIGHLLVEAVHGVLEVLASLLGVLLNLSSIDSNVLVGGLDALVGGLCESGQGTLLSSHGILEGLSALSLVLAHDLTGLLGATDGLTLALVLELGNSSELSLSLTHGLGEVILSLLGVHSHLGEEHLLHGGTSLGVVSHVLCHLGANGGNVSLTRLNLLSDVRLNLVEESEQTLTALRTGLKGVRGLGVEQTSLLQIPRLNSLRSEGILTGASAVRSILEHRLAICGDVHDAAANCQPAQKHEGDTRTVRLRLSHHDDNVDR